MSVEVSSDSWELWRTFGYTLGSSDWYPLMVCKWTLRSRPFWWKGCGWNHVSVTWRQKLLITSVPESTVVDRYKNEYRRKNQDHGCKSPEDKPPEVFCKKSPRLWRNNTISLLETPMRKKWDWVMSYGR